MWLRDAEQWAIHDVEDSELITEDQHEVAGTMHTCGCQLIACGKELVDASSELAENEQTVERPAEERNATAMSILRRVNLKLHGRDKDPSRKASVSEQVGWVIEQATNIDQLAVMYEGWTAWI